MSKRACTVGNESLRCVGGREGGHCQQSSLFGFYLFYVIPHVRDRIDRPRRHRVDQGRRKGAFRIHVEYRDQLGGRTATSFGERGERDVELATNNTSAHPR